MLIEIFYLLLAFYCITDKYSVQACSCETYTYRPYIERRRFLGKLPDLIKLNELSLIGTHISTSCTAQDETLRTQDLTIPQQLKYGVRVFDIRVCPQLSHFEIYPHTEVKGYNFHHILFDINKFLDENPGEFVIMIIHPSDNCDYSGSTKNNCEIIDDYIFNVWGGWCFVTSWKLDDIIGINRNRILLASENPSFAKCTFNISPHCLYIRIRKLFQHSNVYDVNHSFLFIPAIGFDNNIKLKSDCYIFDTSFYSSAFDRRTIAKDGGFSMKSTCGVPVNTLMANTFKQNGRGMKIIVSDYVTQELIDSINDYNFKNSSWRIGWD